MADIVSAVTGVFGAVSTWFLDALPQVVELFYTAPVDGVGGGLTFLGVTSLIATGVAMILMFVRIIGEFVGLSR